MNERACCASCGKPLMIISSLPTTETGTLKIVQVTKLGCLNKECDKHNVTIDTKESRIDTIN